MSSQEIPTSTPENATEVKGLGHKTVKQRLEMGLRPLMVSVTEKTVPVSKVVREIEEQQKRIPVYVGRHGFGLDKLNEVLEDPKFLRIQVYDKDGKLYGKPGERYGLQRGDIVRMAYCGDKTIEVLREDGSNDSLLIQATSFVFSRF